MGPWEGGPRGKADGGPQNPGGSQPGIWRGCVMKSRALVRRFVGGLGVVLLLVPLLLVTAPGAAAAPFAALTLVNGWANAPFSTSNAGVSVSSGVVTLAGAISTAGTNSVPFTLPKPFRPSSSVYVPIDLCNATKARLV